MHHAHVLIILSSNANTQLLLAYGSLLLIKNTLGKTPCGLASDSGQFVTSDVFKRRDHFEVIQLSIWRKTKAFNSKYE